MILKKTILRPSKIHGIGLFANEDIKHGDLVYVKSLQLDLKLSEADFKKLEYLDKKVFLHYGYIDKDAYYCLDFDDIRFLNHADNGNLTWLDRGLVAKIDIKAGDELTQNYDEFKGLAARE